MWSIIGVMCIALMTKPGIIGTQMSDFDSPKVLLDSGMPANGTRVNVPSKDTYGRKIDTAIELAVVAMPACQSCTLKHVNWQTLRSLSRSPIVLIFPGVPDEDYPCIKEERFRVIVESKPPILPLRLHDFGPSCVWLDQKGRIVRAAATIARDGQSK